MTNNYLFKEFEEMNKRAKAARISWETGRTKLDNPNSYTGIWESMNNYRAFMEIERKGAETRFAELGKTFNNNTVSKYKADFDDEFKKTLAVMVSAFHKMISDFTEEKHKQVRKMVRTAPSESMRNLLETLKMRDDLDPVELTDIMPMFFENYHAMRALQSISRQNGVTLNMPVQMDSTFMHKEIDRAKEYLMGAVSEMFTPKSKRTHYNDFFLVNDEEKGKIYAPTYEEIVSVLDYVPQLQDITAGKNGLTALEKAKIEWLYRNVPDDANDTQLAMYTTEIMETYPEDVSLLKLSDKYAKFVELVEIADKE